MTAVPPALAGLFVDLDALGTALQDGAMEAARQALDAHDAGLRALLLRHGEARDEAALQALYARQRGLLAEMEALRRATAARMGTLSEGRRAASAYRSLAEESP